ncbi:MAG: hypothetical protein WBG11_13085 [Methylocella sp.]
MKRLLENPITTSAGAIALANAIAIIANAVIASGATNWKAALPCVLTAIVGLAAKDFNK